MMKRTQGGLLHLLTYLGAAFFISLAMLRTNPTTPVMRSIYIEPT